MKNTDLSPVRLRTKNLSSGRVSLYLDIVKENERRKEYLGLYLVPELNKADKNANKATMKIAEEIKAKRTVELIEGRLSFAGDKAKRTDLIRWLEEQQVYYYNNDNTNYSKTIHNLIRHVRLFRGDKLTMKDVTPGFLRSFLDYMKGNVNKYGGKLSDETIYTYFTVLSILMNKAVRHEIIAANPFHKLSQGEKPQRRTKKKEYLTLDEVKRMAEAECDDIRVKRAFLFCCFTGLRYIDVSRLKWKHISEIGEGEYQIEVVQQKTKEPVYIPLSANALRWLPDRGDDGRENYVFKFRDRSIIYDYLDRWAKKAGVEKHVTHAVQCAYVSYDAVNLPDAAEAQTDSRCCYVVCPAQRFEDSQAEHRAEYEIRNVVHRLVARSSTCSRKAEVFTLFKALRHTEPKIGDDKYDDKYEHPA